MVHTRLRDKLQIYNVQLQSENPGDVQESLKINRDEIAILFE